MRRDASAFAKTRMLRRRITAKSMSEAASGPVRRRRGAAGPARRAASRAAGVGAGLPRGGRVAPAAGSDESRQVIDGDHEEHRERLDDGHREDVPIRFAMREARHREQRDHRAVVRQRVHAAARHRDDPVQHVHRNLRGLRALDEEIGHRRERDAHAARRRPRDPRERADRHRRVDERIRNVLQRVADDDEARQRGDHTAEAVFGRGVHRGEQRAADGRLGARRKTLVHALERGDDDEQDAEQERRLDRPDRDDRFDRRRDRRMHARQHVGRHRVRRAAVPHRNQFRQREVRDADEHERRHREDRMGQRFRLDAFRLVHERRAVAFAARERRAAAPFEIRQADDDDEHRADRAERGRGPRGGLEERRRDDVLDLRRARQRIHRERERAERDRARHQALRNVALAIELGRERIDGEHDDEQRHAAIGEQRAHRDDHRVRARAADVADRGGDDRLGEAGQLDHLAEHGAEQEHREVELHEADHLFHEDAGEDGGDGGGIGQQHRAERGDGGEQDHAVAAVGGEHQERQRGEDDHE
ncbi:hypothetical protein BURPS1710b_A1245 [Burkholderia pseudomallei 1710b]|uniref:Uncharacterized protein n=1 Tax=Burkholderia pseudomallei (strain 1710b) TaxID=320372 RepID=Q3JJ51_BURP1|nr:hypothetical protein BURPS1710b_A1245 [Burkholderia pseudomallei 1710b]